MLMGKHSRQNRETAQGFSKDKLIKFKSLYLPLLLAGLAVMIFEVSFFRAYSFLLGATVQASAIVLSAFMTGLGIGGFVSGRIDFKLNQQRKIRLLLGITGSGFLGSYWLVKFLIGHLADLFTALGAMSDFTVIALAFLAVMLPAVGVGMILPAFAALSEDYSTEDGENGRIYFWETLGSALGGLLAGFVLFRYLGQNYSVLLALFVLVSAGLLVQKENGKNSELPFAQSYTQTENTKNLTPFWLIACFALFNGLAGTGFQVLLLRVFRVYLTNTSYAFALLSTVSVSGLFVGSYLFSRSKIEAKDYRKVAGWQARIVAGTFFGLALIIYFAPNWLILPLHEHLTNNLARLYLPPLILSLFTALPVAILTGYAFPLAVAMLGEQRGKAFSRILLANSLGSAVGPLLISFLLLGMVSTLKSMLILILPLLVIAIFLLRKNKLELVTPILFLLIFTFTRNEGFKILPPSFAKTAKDVLFYKETAEGTIVVGQEEGTSYKSTYINNSQVIGSTYDAVKAVKMLGNLPFLYGNKVEKALIVGFGMGVTTAAVADKPDIEELTCLELATDLGLAADHYSYYNDNVINFAKLKLIEGDGRHYLQKTAKKYDLISSDPTHPILGSAALYSYEYFQLCRSRLTTNGMVSQYLPLHKLRTADFLDILKTFNTVFPNSQLWFGHTHAVLIGSMSSIAPDFISWQRRSVQLRDKLFYSDPYHLAANFAMDGARMQEVTKESEIIHDDKSSLEFFATDAMQADNWLKNYRFMLYNRSNPADFITGIQRMDILERYLEANNLLGEALIYSAVGDRKKFLQNLTKAVQVCPENQEYPFLLQAEGVR